MLSLPAPIELLVPATGICYYHAKTKEKPRLTDGQKHPVRIIRPAKISK